MYTDDRHSQRASRAGAFLEAAIARSGFTTPEAAEVAGVKYGYLRGILVGRIVLPNPSTVQRMAKAWGFSLIDYYLTVGFFTELDVLAWLPEWSCGQAG